jgi:hypothetical protein
MLPKPSTRSFVAYACRIVPLVACAALAASILTTAAGAAPAPGKAYVTIAVAQVAWRLSI